MVASALPLAICFPSGLHATDMTLKLREVRSRINRNREKKTGKNSLARVPGHRALTKVHFEIFYIYVIYENLFMKNKLPFRVVDLTGTQNSNMIFLLFFSSICLKKSYRSGQSVSTGNLQIARPKSWWCRHNCRWQFVFHRDSTPLKGPWNCKESEHKSTETERGKIRGKRIWKKKNVPVWVSGHRRLAITKRNEQKLKENLHALVPQGRLAIWRLQVPNLDGTVHATAGNLLSIGAPRHSSDTVSVRSQ